MRELSHFFKEYTWRATVREAAHAAGRNGDLMAAGFFMLLSLFAAGKRAEIFPFIRWEVLAVLLALMLVLAGLRHIGVLEAVCGAFLENCRTARSVSYFFTAACFVSSMFITNDAALLIFVPESLLLLRSLGMDRWLIHTVVMETLAANLGSTLLPSGNPQNLFLFFHYGMSLTDFLSVTLPITAESAALLFLAGRLVPCEEIRRVRPPVISIRGGKFLLYTALFLVTGAVILRLLPLPALACVCAAALLSDRRLLRAVDWKLLLLFIFLFIGVGNLTALPALSAFLRETIAGAELASAILVSQIISNVPAAVLLSGYTENGAALVAGTDIGGLGTLIASMASLISFRCYRGMEGHDAGKYLKSFTAWNLIFLAALYVVN